MSNQFLGVLQNRYVPLNLFDTKMSSFVGGQSTQDKSWNADH